MSFDGYRHGGRGNCVARGCNGYGAILACQSRAAAVGVMYCFYVNLREFRYGEGWPTPVFLLQKQAARAPGRPFGFAVLHGIARSCETRFFSDLGIKKSSNPPC